MSSLEPLCNFRRNPCSLEHLASVVSAAMLCRQAAMMNSTNLPEKVREIIALPPVIEQKIERFMPLVKEQIAWWNNFYDREIFFDQQCSRAEEYFHVLVWSDDGTINDEETAREMLKRDDLNAEEKYRIACNHCLENEIRALRSNLKEMYLLKKERYYEEHPMVFYWEWVRCYGGTTDGMHLYIRDKVFKVEYNHPACVTDYFLNQFFDSYKRDYIPSSCLQKMSFRSCEKFLMKLSNEQLKLLVPAFYSSGKWKFGDLMRFWMHADFVVQIWMRIRDMYSFPYCEFYDLIEELLKCKKSEFQSTDHISLAVEIFNLASYEMRRSVFDHYNMRDWWNRDSNLTDVRLDVAILSTIDLITRRHAFWALKWFDVFKKYPTDCFVQFMDVCCEEKGSEEFKREIMKMQGYFSPKRCCTLLMEMRFSELDHLLSILSSDPSRIMKTKRKILQLNFFGWINLYETDKFIFPPPNHLVDFIEGAFENIRTANEFKIKVLSSVKFLEACYNVAGSDMFGWLKDAVWMCSCNDDDFKLYKRRFLQLSVELAKASKCDIPDVFRDPGWKSFLEWCSDES